MVIVGVVLLFTPVLYPLSLLPNRGRFLQPFAMALSILSLAIVRRRKRKFAQEVRESEYRVCIQCGYSLKGHPDDGRCPECGYTYTRESLIRYWEAAFKSSFPQVRWFSAGSMD